jgi:colicin import membrane protein
MAKSHLEPMPISGRPSDHRDGGGRVWRWVFFSGVAHAVLIAVLLIVPFLPSKTPSYPVYSVDLVGGEKLGGGAGTALVPAPKSKPVPEVKAAPEVKEVKKKETKKAKEEKPQLAKETKLKAEMTEKVAAAAKAKKEAEEAEAEKVREKLKQLKEKRMEEALAAVRSRAEIQQKNQQLQQQQQQKAAAATSTVAGDKPGAAAQGVGGTGGAIVEDAEFISYKNEIRDRIKNSWSWVSGKRTDLKVLVNISIQENGEITGLKLLDTSGDRSFDDSVARAIRKANPLPAPPEKFRQQFKNVNVPFSLKELGS